MSETKPVSQPQLGAPQGLSNTAPVDVSSPNSIAPDLCTCADASNEHGCPLHGEFYARTAQPQTREAGGEPLEQLAEEILAHRFETYQSHEIAKQDLLEMLRAAGQPEPLRPPQGGSSSDLAEQLAEVRAELKDLNRQIEEYGGETDSYNSMPYTVGKRDGLKAALSSYDALAANEARAEVGAKEIARGQLEQSPTDVHIEPCEWLSYARGGMGWCACGNFGSEKDLRPYAAWEQHNQPPRGQPEPKEQSCGTASADISTNEATLPTVKIAPPSEAALLPDVEWKSLSPDSQRKLQTWFRLATERLQLILDEKSGQPEQPRELLNDCLKGLRVLRAIGRSRSYKTVGKVEMPDWGNPIMETCDELIEQVEEYLLQTAKVIQSTTLAAAPSEERKRG